MFVFRVCRENETVQPFSQLQQAAEELLPRRARARPSSSSSAHLRWAVGGTQAPTDRCHQWPADPDAWRAPGPILFVGSLLLAAVAGATRGCACLLQAHSGGRLRTHRIIRATCGFWLRCLTGSQTAACRLRRLALFDLPLRLGHERRRWHSHCCRPRLVVLRASLLHGRGTRMSSFYWGAQGTIKCAASLRG